MPPIGGTMPAGQKSGGRNPPPLPPSNTVPPGAVPPIGGTVPGHCRAPFRRHHSAGAIAPACRHAAAGIPAAAGSALPAPMGAGYNRAGAITPTAHCPPDLAGRFQAAALACPDGGRLQSRRGDCPGDIHPPAFAVGTTPRPASRWAIARPHCPAIAGPHSTLASSTPPGRGVRPQDAA